MDGSVIEPVDIITFGSPCTDLSVAGRREGLNGNQSVLFFEAIRIIKEMRSATNGRYPRWICWENVPGAFSSNSGHDFQAVLEAVIGIIQPGATVPAPEKSRWPQADAYVGDRWSVAYRTLDAQHWGLPQRRKRVFLVASFADESAWKTQISKANHQMAALSPLRCSRIQNVGKWCCPALRVFCSGRDRLLCEKRTKSLQYSSVTAAAHLSLQIKSQAPNRI